MENGLYIVSTSTSSSDGGAGIRARIRALAASALEEDKPAAATTLPKRPKLFSTSG
jgi:hypothetical protein